MPAHRKDIIVSEPPKNRPLLTTKEGAEYLGVSPRYITDHASGRRQPKLHGYKLAGGRNGRGLWRFTIENLQKFLDSMHN